MAGSRWQGGQTTPARQPMESGAREGPGSYTAAPVDPERKTNSVSVKVERSFPINCKRSVLFTMLCNAIIDLRAQVKWL
jgi:hypothetical protein